jgi:hypothetical protein
MIIHLRHDAFGAMSIRTPIEIHNESIPAGRENELSGQCPENLGGTHINGI